jgi:hypothetical protein
VKHARSLLFLALPLFVAFGCADRGDPVAPAGEGPNPEPTVSYQNDVQPIWNANCLSCHGGNGGLFLTASISRANLVGVVSFGYAPAIRVVPGEPDSSVLFQKLSGNSLFGQRMPAGGALSADDLETVRLWVEEGALDN